MPASTSTPRSTRLQRRHRRAEAAVQALRLGPFCLEPHLLQRRDDAAVAQHRAEQRHRFVDRADAHFGLAEARRKKGSSAQPEGGCCDTWTSRIGCASSGRHAPRRSSNLHAAQRQRERARVARNILGRVARIEQRDARVGQAACRMQRQAKPDRAGADDGEREGVGRSRGRWRGSGSWMTPRSEVCHAWPDIEEFPPVRHTQSRGCPRTVCPGIAGRSARRPRPEWHIKLHVSTHPIFPSGGSMKLRSLAVSASPLWLAASPAMAACDHTFEPRRDGSPGSACDRQQLRQRAVVRTTATLHLTGPADSFGGFCEWDPLAPDIDLDVRSRSPGVALSSTLDRPDGRPSASATCWPGRPTSSSSRVIVTGATDGFLGGGLVGYAGAFATSLGGGGARARAQNLLMLALGLVAIGWVARRRSSTLNQQSAASPGSKADLRSAFSSADAPLSSANASPESRHGA